MNEIDIYDWSTYKRSAIQDEQMNGEKWRYDLAIAKSWLKTGNRLSFMKWVRREDYETHLICKAEKVILVHCTGEQQPYCDLRNFGYNDFLLIPQNHAISEFMPYASWSYCSTRR